MRWTRWVQSAGLVLCTGLMLASCTTAPLRQYEGPARPSSEVVLLEVPVEIDVVRLDGRRAWLSRLVPTPSPRILELLPGPHRIRVRYSVVLVLDTHDEDHRVVRSPDMTLRWRAEAGKRYALRFDPEHAKALQQERRDDMDVWIEEVHPLGQKPQGASERGPEEAQHTSGSHSEEKKSTVSKRVDAGSEQGVPSTLNLLKGLWSSATPEERDRFKRYIDSVQPSRKP